MTDGFVLAIDQGTSATKAVLVDAAGAIVARAVIAVGEAHPAPGWVQQSAEHVHASVVRAVAGCLRGHDPGRVVAVGLSTQRESLVLWERATGTPLGPLLSWQDQRTAAECRRLRAAGAGELVRAVSGLPLDPMFSALKATWLLNRYDPRRVRSARGELCLGTVDSWLLSRFSQGPPGTGPHVVELGNAARTQLLDVRRRQWDPRLLDLFGVPEEVLPQIVSSQGPFPAAAGLDPLPPGVPVTGVMGDSHAALFGHAGWRPGRVKATYGTGSSVMGLISGPGPAGGPTLDAGVTTAGGRSRRRGLAEVGTPPTPPGTAPGSGDIEPDAARTLPEELALDGLCLTIGWDTGQPAYAVEGNIRATGAALTWLAGLLDRTPAELAEIAATATSDGVHLVPAFNGLGAPWWDGTAVGLLSGLTLGSGVPQLARAALEAIAFQVEDVVAAMDRYPMAPQTPRRRGSESMQRNQRRHPDDSAQRNQRHRTGEGGQRNPQHHVDDGTQADRRHRGTGGGRVHTLLADGGPTGNPVLMQLQADTSGRIVRRAQAGDLSALGAAHLAGLTRGLWSWADLEAMPRPARTFRPEESQGSRLERIAAWHAAVARSRHSGLPRSSPTPARS